MRKRAIWGLVILMGFSLLGIIGVQYYWFVHSVQVRNELFDRSVNEAMNQAVRQLATGRDVEVIRDLVSDSIVVPGHSGKPLLVPHLPIKGEFNNVEVIVLHDSLRGRITVTSSQKNHAARNESIRIKTSIVRLGQASIVDSTHALEMVVGSRIDQLKKLSKQMALEFKGYQQGRDVDEKALNIRLKEALTDRDIPIGFNLSIHRSDSAALLGISGSKRSKRYQVNLFPNDIFRKNIVLELTFPERDHFISRSTMVLLVVSVLFTSIIFITFLISLLLIMRQKKISEMKSDFLNNMTHEFKTPIATIAIAADSIVNPKVITNSERVEFFASMIRKENHRMNEQVERILQIAQMDRHESDFHFQEVDIHPLIEEAITAIRLQVESREGVILAKLQAARPLVTTDPVHFMNVVYNLLDNANKYSPEKPFIEVTTQNSDTGIVLIVEDQGMGMSASVQHRIFERFYRQTSGNIHNVKGFGLGLSYVKGFIEANGGTIRVSSEPGKGSRFTIFIPFKLHGI